MHDNRLEREFLLSALGYAAWWVPSVTTLMIVTVEGMGWVARAFGA